MTGRPDPRPTCASHGARVAGATTAQAWTWATPHPLARIGVLITVAAGSGFLRLRHQGAELATVAYSATAAPVALEHDIYWPEITVEVDPVTATTARVDLHARAI